MTRAQQNKDLRYARRVALNSMLILIGLTLMKGFGGYVSDTVSLLGDAAASFGDLIATIAIFVGISFSLRPPSKRFKYGYHRIETLVSLIISITMVYFAVQLLKTSALRIADPTPTKLVGVGLLTAILSIGLSLYTYRYQNKIAKKINSQAFLAAAEDKRNDAIITGGVLGGIITNYFNVPVVEKLVGVGIALAVLWTGLRTFKDSLLYLLDYWDDPALTHKIEKIIRKSSLVTGIKNIRLRHAGTFIFGEAFITVNSFTDITDLRDEIHRLNTEIKQKIPHLGDFVLYVDPPRPETMVVAVPVAEDKNLTSLIADHFSKPFSVLLVHIKNRKIQQVENHSKRTFTENDPLKLVNYLKEKKVNILISNHIKAVLFYYLRLNNIKVYPHFSNVKDVGNTLKLLLLDV